MKKNYYHGMSSLLTMVLALLLPLSATWADPVNKEQALEKAKQFYNNRGQASKVKKLRQVKSAAEPLQTELASDCFYVFSAGEGTGFVIISGDDRTAPVLGYADSGTFDTDAMPENMKSWLDGYARQIRHLQRSAPGAGTSADGGDRAMAPARVVNHAAVAPLLSTKWDQDAPYNNLCPVFFDESKYGRTVTGCVATAMAQIMKYHNHPAKTTQTIPGYKGRINYSGVIGSSSAAYIDVPDVPVTTFDWGNMLDTYNGGETDAQKTAVAKLMQACGASVEMSYGISRTGGSSGKFTSLKKALITYFDYDKSMMFVSRTDYNATEWDELIYAELSSKRAVFYGGDSSNGAHEFVVDGYDGSGYFHVNWGWGGLHDGYFLLDILTPEDDSGIGAGTGGYNYKQHAIIGIKPNAGGDVLTSDVLTSDSIRIIGKSSYSRSSASADFSNVSVSAPFFNFTGDTGTFDLGYAVYDANDKQLSVYPVMTKVSLPTSRGFNTENAKHTFSFGANLKDGQYKIMPVSKWSKSSQWLPNKGTKSNYIMCTINGNTLMLAYPSDKMQGSMTLTNSPEVKGPADLKYTITNNGADYIGNLRIIKTVGTKIEDLYQEILEIKSGETLTRTASVIINEKGSFYLLLLMDDGTVIANVKVDVADAKEQSLKLTFNVPNANSSNEVSGSGIQINIEYENTGQNNYDNNVQLNLRKITATGANSYSYEWVSKKNDRVTVAKGGKVQRSYVFDNLEDGATYDVKAEYLTKGQYKDGGSSDDYTFRYTAPAEKSSYAVLDGSTLTIYYDDQKDNRQGKKYSIKQLFLDRPGWAKDSLKIQKVRIDPSYASRKPTNLARWFDHHINLTSIEGLEYLNTSSATTMRAMFNECYSLQSVDVSKFNTQNVTDMGWMFYGCRLVKNIDVKNFNTSKVTNMRSMFNQCSSVTSLDVSNFDTQNVTNMGYMFFKCSSVTSLDLSKFNTAKVTDMNSMLYECKSLTALDVSSFDTQNVTNMAWMFYGCSSVTSLNLSKFNTAQVTNMRSMFYECKSLTALDVSSFDTQNVTDMGWMFYGCSSAKSIKLGSKFNTSKVTNMKSLFYQCSSLTSIETSKFDTRNVTDMSYMFYGCSSVTSLNFSNFNTAQVTDINSFLYECKSLTAIDVSSFDTRNVTHMGWMFYGCSSANSIKLGSNFITSKVTNMKSMFCGCSSLPSIDTSRFDTRNVTDMSYMFYGCKSMPQVNVSSFNTTNVNYMEGMFSNCENLTSLDITNFYTGNLWKMSYMFWGCSKLTELDLTSFTTATVELMVETFYNCTSLKTIYVSGIWTVVNMDFSTNMFGNCTSLVGGAGTKYDPNHVDHHYAWIDEGPSRPGYFTYKARENKGDANGDGSISVSDIVAIANYIAGDHTLPASALDVNGDGSVSVSDIVAIANMIASK